ncbi:DUF3105 domain-containing protein [Phycicoccus avicenniae]|nr:DUF3105 domain-containing protein [Phycicoccus avicenniae]
MSKNSGTSGRKNRDALEAMKKQQAAKERRSRLLLVGGIAGVVLVIAGIVGVTIYRDVSTRPTLDAVQEFDGLTADHVTEPVEYDQTPPVGGNHHPVWLNCGVYDVEVPANHAVHSLEHGAVWVTYRPDLPADQVEALVDSVPDTYMIVSPMEGLQAPVVASAWGVQLELDGVDDRRLEQFVRDYRQGPQTPEPGAACTGGTDESGMGGAAMEQPSS